MGPDGYVSDHLTSTRVEGTPGTPPDAPRSADDAGSRDGSGHSEASSSGATNSARTPSCPNCAALTHSSRLLADSALYLIDRNAELSRQLAAYHDRDRHGAEMLLGLANLQAAPL